MAHLRCDFFSEVLGLSTSMTVILPQVHRSFYRDEVHGSRCWTFLTQELPTLVQSFFRLSSDHSDTFVAVRWVATAR